MSFGGLEEATPPILEAQGFEVAPHKGIEFLQEGCAPCQLLLNAPLYRMLTAIIPRHALLALLRESFLSAGDLQEGPGAILGGPEQALPLRPRQGVCGCICGKRSGQAQC